MDMAISNDMVYAAMITGHSRAGDLKAAECVIDTIKAKGDTAHSTVYSSLLCAYAERGLLEDIKKVVVTSVCVSVVFRVTEFSNFGGYSLA